MPNFKPIQAFNGLTGAIEEFRKGLKLAVSLPCTKYVTGDCGNHRTKYVDMCDNCKKFWDWAITTQVDSATLTVDELVTREMNDKDQEEKNASLHFN